MITILESKNKNDKFSTMINDLVKVHLKIFKKKKVIFQTNLFKRCILGHQ